MKPQLDVSIVMLAGDVEREVVRGRSSSAPRFTSIIGALEHWAEVVPDKTAYVFLSSAEHRISYRELHQSVAGVATQLRADGLAGERVLLLMGSGIDYLVGFLASLAAGAIAVPLYPPASERDRAKLRAVMADCSPRVVLINKAVENGFAASLADLATDGGRCLLVEDLLAAGAGVDPRAFRPEPIDLAFLQYTSGSTGAPKGVMVAEGNILHNQRMMAVAMGADASTVYVSWLPFHHDMGMIGMNLQSLLLGAQAVLMSPRTFVRDPARWLRAIATYKGTIAGGPNFAYDMCIAKVGDAEIDRLDLSSWRVAFNGAEPIKASTLARFHERFGRAGLARAAIFPCYGLAEGTLYAAGGPHTTLPSTLDLDRSALNGGMVSLAVRGANGVHTGEPADHERIATYVGLGLADGQTLRIVDPSTWEVLPEQTIGEIWLKSGSVTRGYWNKPKATAETFHGYTTDSGEGPFLRTGDLGFVLRGRLYITGRIKELIIVNGVNYYPQDLEHTVQAESADFRVHYGAAFHIDDDRFAVVQALNRGVDPARYEDLMAAIRRSVLRVHGIAPSCVALVHADQITKTSSGKIQRADLRRRFHAGSLGTLALWQTDQSASRAGPAVDGESLVVESVVASAAVESAVASPTVDSPLVQEKIAWIQRYCSTRFHSSVADERRTLPPHVVLDFGNQGLLGMQAPPEYGGLGLTTREFLRVMEVLGGKDLTLALFVGLNNVLGIRPVVRFGSAELKARYLGALASGRELASFALTEPAAGSNPQAIETSARASADGTHRLTGRKVWSGSAAWAGLMNVFARTVDGSGRATGISAFAVPQTSAGVRQGPEALTMGMRGMTQNAISFDDVPVEPWQVLGQIGHGMTVAQDALCYGRLAIGATCLGAARLCVQIMLQYAGRREISTGNLLDNPHTRAVLTEAMHAMAGIDALIDAAAERVDAGEEVAPEVLAICKSVSSEFLWKTVDRAMQLLGGRGYIESNFIPQLFRDARIFRVFEGPTETLNHFVGSSALRGRAVIRDFLLGFLDEAAVARHYDSVVNGVRSTRPGADPAAETWHGLAVGEYLNHLVTYAAAFRPGVPAEARRWLLEQVDDAAARLEAALGRFASIDSADALRRFGRAIDERIGRREPSCALPDTSLDPLLAGVPAEPAAARPSNGVSHAARPEAGRSPPRQTMPSPAAPAARSVPAAPAARSVPPAPVPVVTVPAAPPAPASAGDVASFISRWIARRSAQPVASIGVDVEFAMLGLGSVDSVDLSAALSEKYGLELDPTVMWNYPSVRELAQFVVAELASAGG